MKRPIYFGDSVENFKRRRALGPGGGTGDGHRAFFERSVEAKKEREVVFIPKGRGRGGT